MPWAQVDPVLDFSVRQLCRKPYHGHPRGCPNWEKRPTCPPEAPLLPDVIRLDGDRTYVVWNDFDFIAHVTKMRARHPDWSDRQLRCCLYWQGTARKQLEAKITLWKTWYGGTVHVIRCPEACGVNVTETMLLADVELEWPPVNVVRQVALVGMPR